MSGVTSAKLEWCPLGPTSLPFVSLRPLGARSTRARGLNVADRALDALDQLIGGWNYWDQYESMYLNELAPAIVARTARMNDREAELVAILSGLLTEGEWESLPELIRLRRAGERGS
jgi:hypothetical protein